MKAVIASLISIGLAYGSHTVAQESSISEQDLVPSFEEQSQAQFRIVDEAGNPVANVEVRIGEPSLKGTTIITDSNGQFAVPKAWDKPFEISLSAPGYINIAYDGVSPAMGQLEISKEDGKNFTKVSGITKNYGDLKKDGKVDFALILPLFDIRSILQFDIASVLSPETDTLNFPGGRSMNIPSNISLPKQFEKYLFFNLEFNKPDYRFFFRNEGPQQVIAAHGRFPLRKVIRDFQANKSIFEIMNHFEFIQAGSEDVDIKGTPIGDKDIAIDTVKFDQQLRVKAPKYANGLVMTSIALSGENGLFYPSDIKSIKSGRSQRLTVAGSAAERRVLGILSEPLEFSSEDKEGEAKKQMKPMSFVLMEEDEVKNAPEFLDLGQTPTYNQGVISAKLPASLAGVNEIATYVVVSEIEKLGSGSLKSEKRTRILEFYRPGWTDSVMVPGATALTFDPAKNYRWEVLYLGSNKVQNTGGSFVTLDELTHVSRSTLDF